MSAVLLYRCDGCKKTRDDLDGAKFTFRYPNGKIDDWCPDCAGVALETLTAKRH